MTGNGCRSFSFAFQLRWCGWKGVFLLIKKSSVWPLCPGDDRGVSRTFTQDFHLGPKPPIIELPSHCSHPDLWGLIGTLFGSIFDENWSGVAVLKKWPFFLWSKGRFLAVFHQIWTSEGPNVVKIMRARVSDHLFMYSMS